MALTIFNAVFSQVPDLAQAIASLTTWSRLEALPYTPDLQPSLQAQIADPLWFVARQWQFGEFQGEDAGTPIEVRVAGERTQLARYVLGALGDNPSAGAKDYQQENLPLEILVEREAIHAFHPRVNAEAGLQFLDTLIAENAGHLRGAYIAQYPVKLLDDKEAFGGELVDPKSVAWRKLLAGRGLDGRTLAMDLRPFADVNYQFSDLPSNPVLATDDQEKVKRAAARWLRWYDETMTEPAANRGIPEAWNPQRQEYALALSAKITDGPVVLTASEYSDGDLDWYSFNVSNQPDLGKPATTLTPENVQPSPMLPTLVRYPGMPADRYWEFEDGAVNLGMIQAGPTDLSRMLLAEFGLIYGNDWFIVPLDLPVGSMFKITQFTVRDTFGVETMVNASRNTDGTTWTMFGLTSATNAPAYLRDVFFLAPTLPTKLQGDPIEEVALFRDEMANMVWGVERRVQGASGESYNRYHEATQIAAQQQLTPGDGDSTITADILYRLATSVPENWIPFVAVPAQANQPASQFQIQLERRAMLRTLFDGTQELIQPRGVLLRSDPSQDVNTEPLLRIEEEEVPRAGIVVQRLMQYARWIDGRAYLWLGRNKLVGFGEGASGLRFDAIVPTRGT
ncbi:MAG: hypothetical protein HY868_06415 [Chloroflexi bacterium]|nr:hypothetical protein [Chloroflexota bacterium]